MFRKGDLSISNEPRSSRSLVLDDEALMQVIKDDNSQNCDDFAEGFQVSDETIRLHLLCIDKAYKLNKCVLTHCQQPKRKKK